MSLSDLCESGKCGICCFYYFRDKGFFIARKKRFHKLAPDLAAFLKVHEFKVVKRDRVYRTGINESVALVAYDGYKFNPCSFLDVRHDGERVTSLFCSVHDSEFRPFICGLHRIPSDSSKPCSILFYEGVKRVEINGKEYSFNPEFKEVLSDALRNCYIERLPCW